MAKLSAGLLMFRRIGDQLEIFLVHPGGPFWEKKDFGAWSLPKGEYTTGEEPLQVAKREFEEETSIVPQGVFLPIGVIKQQSGKIVTAWAFEGNLDPADVKSNFFSMEWPPKSGKVQQFPEVDRGEWFPFNIARKKILKGQAGFLDQLLEILAVRPSSDVIETDEND
jgi:predicted NUDIX family NTP pyrophosphohydrolase